MSCSSPCVLGLWWLCEIRMPGIDRGGLAGPIQVGGHDQPRPALEDEVLDPVAVAFQRPRDEHPRGPGVGGGSPSDSRRARKRGWRNLSQSARDFTPSHARFSLRLAACSRDRTSRASIPAGSSARSPLRQDPAIEAAEPRCSGSRSVSASRLPRPQADREPPGGTPRPFGPGSSAETTGRAAGGGRGRPPPGDELGPHPGG